MRKLPECDRCQLYAHNPHLICAIHPAGVSGDSCLDFAPDPNAPAPERWEPVGTSYYNGELILDSPVERLTKEQQLAWTHIQCLQEGVQNAQSQAGDGIVSCALGL